jgi:hypothetical protein
LQEEEEDKLRFRSVRMMDDASLKTLAQKLLVFFARRKRRRQAEIQMFSFAEFRKHTYSQDKVKIQILKHIMFSHQKNSRGLWLTVCQIRRIIRSAEVHLDVVQVFALAQIVVIGSGEEARLVTPYYGLQITAIHIEIQRLESIHRHPACCYL